MGAELCLAHDMGGWRHWGPLSVDMQPYGCFICLLDYVTQQSQNMGFNKRKISRSSGVKGTLRASVNVAEIYCINLDLGNFNNTFTFKFQ